MAKCDCIVGGDPNVVCPILVDVAFGLRIISMNFELHILDLDCRRRCFFFPHPNYACYLIII